VPIIRGSNLPDDKSFSEEDFVFVREQKADDLLSNNAYRGDLIFTQRGTLGQVGLIPKTATYDRYVIPQSQMKLTVDPLKADARFVYYYFRHPQTVQSIKNRAITSGVPHINLGILKEFRLPLPPIDKQHEIVKILAAYDDLIENNGRRIALLEEAARLLYREWFVYLRFPGHEHVKVVDGVPEGWGKQPLGVIAKFNYGKALKEDHRVAGPYPVYGSSGIVGWHEKPLVAGPGIVVGRKGNVGSIYWSNTDFYPIDTVYFIDNESSSYYLYFALRHIKFIRHYQGS
jgi:type I restriction enzyme, S subunit